MNIQDFSFSSQAEKEIKEALYKRAIGYDYEEKVVEARKDGTEGKVRIIKKHMPPSEHAVQIIYEMIQRGMW